MPANSYAHKGHPPKECDRLARGKFDQGEPIRPSVCVCVWVSPPVPREHDHIDCFRLVGTFDSNYVQIRSGSLGICAVSGQRRRCTFPVKTYLPWGTWALCKSQLVTTSFASFSSEMLPKLLHNFSIKGWRVMINILVLPTLSPFCSLSQPRSNCA